MKIRFRSSTMLISLGLACLTLSVVLVAHSLGIAPDTSQSLLRARMQTVELVAAQCSPAAAAGDVPTMAAIVREVAARNPDLASAGLRRENGELVFGFGPHAENWGQGDRGSASAVAKLSVPIGTGKADWGRVEFCFRRAGMSTTSILPPYVAQLLANPALRVGAFVAIVGFICYFFYLRRTLRHLDPSSVIPPRVRAMLDALAEGIVVLDGKGMIIMANESFARAIDADADRLQGYRADHFGWCRPNSSDPCTDLPWTQVLSTGQPVKAVPLALPVTPPSDGAQATTEPAAAQKTQRLFSVNATPVLGPDGRVRGALATFDDVTEVEEMNALLKESRDEVERQNVRLRLLATTDPLTGCLNRRSFLEQFEALWARAATEGTPLGCIMLDIDKFKSINDRFGHPAGDAVLKDVSRIVTQTAAAQNGIVCRYGGEEFCVLLPGKDLAATSDLAEQIRRNVESERWQITPVTSSFGASCSDPGAADVKTLLDQADRALYSSKRTGRNRVTRWGSIPEAGSVVEAPATAAAHAPATAAEAPSALSDPKGQAGFLALASALTYRSAATALHSRRVADYCLAAAPGLLAADEAAELEVAALLHDVGKMGVPDAILNKPGPLTSEEWEVMRYHDKVSIDLVAVAGLPHPIVCLVGAHHDKYSADPQESPAASAGNLIIAARLLTIADGYDAMTSDRPYRKAMPRDAALAELRRCAGTQFDPAVVEHFVASIERGAAATHRAPLRAA
jgi:diguanylate cyclase (GGDEF)-like protein